MCEMFGTSFSREINVGEYLSEFFSHSIHHPHGWGILREQSGIYEIIKEPVCACKSILADSVAQNTSPQKVCLAHIRLATVGAKDHKNCHPFQGKDMSGRQWTLIHNGTIYSDNTIYKYRNTQTGSTDSERVFLYLIDKINEKCLHSENYLNDKQRFEVVDQLVQDLSRRNKLNLIIFDGENLYVHKNMEGTLYFRQSQNGFIFSTQPLDNKLWNEFPTAQLFAYKNGHELFSGTAHGKVFAHTLQYITAMDAMNI